MMIIDCFFNIAITAPFGKSDHAIITFQIDVPKSNHNSKKSYLDFHNASYVEIDKQLNNCDWSVMENMNCSDAWNFFS